MATSLEESEKDLKIVYIHANTYHLVNKIVKIGPVGPDIIILKFKKKIKKIKKN